MPRRKRTIRTRTSGEPFYGDTDAARFVVALMKDGKRSTACRIFTTAMELLREKTGQEPISIFKKALANVKPRLEVRPRRVGGATYQIPVEVPPKRSLALAIRWIIESSRTRKGRPMAERLVDELLEAARGEGSSVKKREDMHKMAESNRAFAHYRW